MDPKPVCHKRLKSFESHLRLLHATCFRFSHGHFAQSALHLVCHLGSVRVKGRDIYTLPTYVYLYYVYYNLYLYIFKSVLRTVPCLPGRCVWPLLPLLSSPTLFALSQHVVLVSLPSPSRSRSSSWISFPSCCSLTSCRNSSC